jgi:hypothetical protein
VAGKLVHAALVAVVAVVLSAPVAIAQRADSNGTGHHVQAAARTVQPDPRDPFDAGAAGGGTGSGAGGGASAAPGGVTGEHTLPRTGSRAVWLVSVAVALLCAGLMALWASRYRPRHGSYRPRRAR